VCENEIFILMTFDIGHNNGACTRTDWAAEANMSVMFNASIHLGKNSRPYK